MKENNNYILELLKKETYSEAYKEAYREAYEKGIKEGMKKAQIEIAKNLLDVLDDEIIANVTELDVEKIKEFRKNQK